MGSSRIAAIGGVLAVGLFGCEPAVRPGALPPRDLETARAERVRAASGSASEERSRVSYPRGDCRTGRIEVQIHEPGRGWIPHPEHPQVFAGDVHFEETARLLSELRVRCVDPAGRTQPSPWLVGVKVGGAGPAAGAP